MKKNIVNIFLMAAFVMLWSCKEEVEFNIDHLQKSVRASFSVDKNRVFLDEQIQFTNASVGAAKYEWTFEGGEPGTSSEENPVVSYGKEGKYKVTLKAINDLNVSIYEQTDFVTVFGDESWKDFIAPTINFENTATDKSLYNSLVPNPEVLIQNVCFDVSRWLFVSPDEMDVLKNIDYTVEDNDGISAKGGQAPNISIFFSATYLQSCKEKGMTDAQLMDEILGVLYHEITHGYQFSPQGAGQYKQGDDFFGFIEGMADYVRYVSGYFTTADRNQGGHWNDGYRTSGFFIDWLHTKDQNFLNKFNKSAKTINPWSWEKATQQIIGKSVEALWAEYQDDMKTGKIAELDDKLRRYRAGEDVDFGNDGEVTGPVVDITDQNPTVTYQAEGFDFFDWGMPEFVYDNDAGTSFFNMNDNTWFTFETENAYNVTKVAITATANILGIDYVFTPDEFVVLGSNDGTEWTEITAVENTGIVNFEERKEFTFENSQYYKFHKITLAADIEEGDNKRIMIGELELYGVAGEVVNTNPVVDIVKQNPTVTYQAEGFDFFDWGLPEFAYDNDVATSFFNMNDNTWFTFETEKAYNVNKVAITATANILGIDYVFTPDEFVLLGSNDGTEWTEITAVENTGIVSFEERKEFSFDNSEYYKFHKITMAADIEEGDNKRIMIAELELYGVAR